MTDLLLSSRKNWITQINSALAKVSPGLAVFFQRAYMKTSTTLRPVRRFRTLYGATLQGNVSDFLLKRMCFFGVYEPALTRFMIETIKPGQTVVDVGANVGYFTLLMSRLVGDGTVVSIEAWPDMFRSLEKHIEINKAFNVRAKAIAVADRQGAIEMVDRNPFNSGLRTTVLREGDEKGVFVPCDRLLTILGPDVERTSFIKIDIEGAERAPLLEIIASKHRFPRPFTIVSEVSEGNRDLTRLFADAGFDVRVLPNDYSWLSYLRAKQIDGRSAPLSEKRLGTEDYVFQLA